MKRINALAMFSSLALALAVPTITACTDMAEDDIEFAEPTNEIEAEKADEATLAFTTLDVGGPVDGFTERVAIIKTKTRWREVFGSAAPASVNFNKQWVAVYTTGARNSGGYTASVTKIRLSASGKTMTVVTNIDSPGPHCLVTQAITFPYAVVAFKKPATAPTSTRSSKQSSTYTCDPEPACSSVDTVTSFIPSTDNRECAVETEVCVTTNHGSCPQISPLPPTFCQGGHVEAEPNYVDSADGDGSKCYLPRLHCITNDASACPQISPLPPTYCTGGTVKPGRHYVSSADGKECSLPAPHCVSNNPAACPI